MKLKSIGTFFWWNYLKPLRKGWFFFSFNISLSWFTFADIQKQNHISITNQLFSTDLKSIFLPHYKVTSHTLSRNGNSSGRHESDLEATVAESRCCFPWVGAADLKRPKGRVSEEECWRNSSKLFVLTRELRALLLRVSLLCDCFPAPRLWICLAECCSHSHTCYVISCSVACGCLTR